MQRNTGDTQCWLTHDQPFWSLVSELQRQVLAKISPTFGGCPQSQHGHQDLAATLSIEDRESNHQDLKDGDSVIPVKLVKPDLNQDAIPR